MNQIICPNCKTAFDIEEAGYADILKQVRDEEFKHELLERERRFSEEKESAIKLAEANLKNVLQIKRGLAPYTRYHFPSLFPSAVFLF